MFVCPPLKSGLCCVCMSTTGKWGDLCLCVHYWKVGGSVFVCPPLESGYIPVVVYGITFFNSSLQHCVYIISIYIPICSIIY